MRAAYKWIAAGALAAAPGVASGAPNKPMPPGPGDELAHRLEAIASSSTQTQFALPQFAFTGNLSIEKPGSTRDVVRGLPPNAIADASTTQAVLVDPSTAWMSTQLGEHYGCSSADCSKDPADGWLRATALFEKDADGWQPTAWSITPSIPSGSQQDAIDEGVMPDAIARDTSGADDVAKLFESTCGDPKKLAATFSDHKETVLFGSELPERYVGAKAGAQIKAWNFSFVVRDGLRAGLSKSGNVAWVAANVDGIPHGTKTKFPFRMFALYEKTASGWKVVQMQFATSV
jgi:ketosteroid isomerase-like protein